MTTIAKNVTETGESDILALLFTQGFDATLTFFCTLFVFSVD